jgi:alpha-aminoadipate carrier protein LysW
MMNEWQDADVPVLAACPACGAAVDLPEDPVLGEVIWCDGCGAELEIMALEPLRVELFEEEEK